MRFKCCKWLVWVGVCIFSNLVFAQEPVILSNDKYSGISSSTFSPTQPYLNPNSWDLHLFSENIFTYNDYIYIGKTSVLGLLKGDIESVDLKRGITGKNTARVSDYFNKDLIGYHFKSEFMGPSFSMNLNILEKKISVGLFSKLRTYGSAKEVNNYLQFNNQGMDEPPLYDLAPFTTNFMNWAEIGINFGTEIYPYSQYQWILGVNLKYEMGLDAFYVNNKKNALMRREFVPDPENPEQNIKNLHISDFDIEVGYATNYDFDTKSYEFKESGKGYGIDVGIAVVDIIDNDDDYNFRGSLNILDIGYVNFKGNVHNYRGQNLQYTNNPNFDDVEFESPEQYAQLISNELYGDAYASHISNSFKIGLPTSIHLNLSKNIGENQFLNFDWVQRTPIYENSLKRANMANVSYSVQKPTIGYGTSISTYEYKNLQIGGFLRLGPLLIGSENILPLFFRHSQLHAFDFYIGLKLYPLWDNEMKRRNREKCKC